MFTRRFLFMTVETDGDMGTVLFVTNRQLKRDPSAGAAGEHQSGMAYRKTNLLCRD